MIPLASPLAQYRSHAVAIDDAIRRVLDSGQYILGHDVERFEGAFADFCGTVHAIGVNSGTDALALALRALDIGAGHEVITVSHTALATAAAIFETGATPVLVDVDPRNRTIDIAGIEAAVTPRSRAIVPVHIDGQAVEMDAVLAIAKRHGLKVIEDCAQAAGGRYQGRRLGALGDAGCFSFYPTKNLGAIGDGGMVVSSDPSLAGRVRRLRQYGWDERRRTNEAGFNSRLDALQAAILLAKLPRLDEANERRVAIARRYASGLAGLPLTLPAIRPGGEHVFHHYAVECDESQALFRYLAGRDIGAAACHRLPVHRHDGYATRVIVPPAGLPVTESLAARVLGLPIYPELNDADADRVVAAVRAFFTSGR
ncbi:MAG: DegT/DnrJ/EryC1/StrS family aminotransferase [Proteobacteria bacterium]|nr:DegT/DnrJ/EryC1/StrS family aminotransferase [Pseudomonadota bacterium]